MAESDGAEKLYAGGTRLIAILGPNTGKLCTAIYDGLYWYSNAVLYTLIESRLVTTGEGGSSGRDGSLHQVIEPDSVGPLPQDLFCTYPVAWMVPIDRAPEGDEEEQYNELIDLVTITN